MAGEKAPYFKFYVFDWDSDFVQRALDCAGAGIYARLMVIQWIEGGLLDDPDLLRRHVGATQEQWDLAWRLLDAKFPVCPDGLRRNERLEEERREMERASELQFLRGSKGGRPRTKNPDETRKEPGKNPDETHGLAPGYPRETRGKANQNQNQNQEPEGEGTRAEENLVYPHAFAVELIEEINRHLPGLELKPHPAISFAVGNLLAVGHPKGIAFANGRTPLTREDLVDAAHGWIVAESKDQWHAEQRADGKPFAFSRLVLDPDRLAEYAERGRSQWASFQTAPHGGPVSGIHGLEHPKALPIETPVNPEITARHQAREAERLERVKAWRAEKPPEGMPARDERLWWEQHKRRRP